MKGSHRATRPSVSGSSVRTLAWAMGADPMPASLENAARRKPCRITPSTPPCTPSGVNAPVRIEASAAGIAGTLLPITTSPANR